ncbi:MAG: endopeptidase La [Cytophagales bacterium]|nr:endopeptidase La [Cytophagales bacterium]MDW8383789.1 endopeptidase La [Flammeovirgaceae bacterium]
MDVEQPSSNEILSENEEIELPILPIRNTVLFPSVLLPITVGRQRSIRLVKKFYRIGKPIGVVAQSNPQNDEPTLDDLYKVGTIAKILKLLVLPDGNTTIIIQGIQKFEVQSLVSDTPYLTARAKILKDFFPSDSKRETKALLASIKETALKILNLNPDVPREAQIAIHNIENPEFLIYFLCSNLNAETAEKQALLEIADNKERASKLLGHLLKELQMLQLKHEIQTKVHHEVDQQQRDYFLRQQMKILQNELGIEGVEIELKKLRAKAEQKKWPEKAKQHFEKELDKIQRMNQNSPDYGIHLNYAELLVDLPWNEVTTDNFDLKNAREILDKDHYGLEKIKDRIIEYLAVLKLKQDMRGPILCLYGPPGVGKTSLGKSIAKALGRNYVRMSLGGLHDEAEIRGHRKTYIGAMPGKIISNIKKAGSSNPVFVLDEIDKIGTDFRGDPSSALLEVLDPEQNNAFVDNYLEIEYDLSRVLFIATCNSLDTIQPALRDRMEIIEVTGYTLEEKIEIARRHLIPKQREENGLKAVDFTLEKAAIQRIIEGYTRESGVRNLERKIGTVVRKVAVQIATEQPYEKKITAEMVEKMLGAPPFDKEIYENNEIAGVVVGLAWTPVGGDILYIEASLHRGKGRLILSGQLGDVMKESATAALSYLRAHDMELGIDYRIFENYDLHIHVPAGAVPKDGPSAGITMLTAMASVFTQRKVKPKLAMTGEITLRGKVLPVGGIKEKLLAAKRAGIKEIILCERNRKDVNEIDEKYTKGIKFHFVDTVSEVLDVALLPEKVKNPIQFILEEKKAISES